jgi:hypothetical protein
MVRAAHGKSHILLFKAAIVTATAVAVGSMLCLLPAGRYAVAVLNSALQRWTVGLRDPTDVANLKRMQAASIEAAKAAVEVQWADAGRSERAFLRATGLAPDQALCRTANGTGGCILSGKVFEADARRSYRFRPDTRSVWVRVKPKSGAAQSILVPDDPQVRSDAQALGYEVLGGTEQTTSSWACRGPEPNTSAELRILVLGDSFMQGMFLAEADTAPRQLEARLHTLTGRTVCVLNTGHLGYSPEEYYYTALEYAPKFRPDLVLISVCFNDTMRAPGSEHDLLNAKDWLNKTFHVTRHDVVPPPLVLLVLAPLHRNLEQTRNALNYPSGFMDMVNFRGARTLDPTEAFINEDLRLRGPRGMGPLPLFNIHLQDDHFSARGCAVWAEEAARRILLILDSPTGGSQNSSSPVRGPARLVPWRVDAPVGSGQLP